MPDNKRAKSKAAIKVKGVSKTFKLHGSEKSLKTRLIEKTSSRGIKLARNNKILKDISFQVEKGDFYAILGRNGSGKSTLLKILAGVYSADKGSVDISGKLVPFIELGVGFNPELTGRDNVYLNGSLLGFSREEINEMYDSIVSFAELEKFMDEKLKNYSSGMQVRLAFSIAIRADSEILLIDEVLAVGDAVFQEKCFKYFRELRKNKKTVVFVSHDIETIRIYCDKAIYIKNGTIKARGKIDKVISAYEMDLSKDSAAKNKPEKNSEKEIKKDIEKPSYSKLMGLEKITVTKKIYRPEEEISVVVDVKANTDLDDYIVGITVRRSGESRATYANNTKIEEICLPPVKIGDKLKIGFKFDNQLGNGSYDIDVAVADATGRTFYDKVTKKSCISVTGWRNQWVEVHIPGKIEL